jgi:hypothetical protein
VVWLGVYGLVFMYVLLSLCVDVLFWVKVVHAKAIVANGNGKRDLVANIYHDDLAWSTTGEEMHIRDAHAHTHSFSRTTHPFSRPSVRHATLEPEWEEQFRVPIAKVPRRKEEVEKEKKEKKKGVAFMSESGKVKTVQKQLYAYALIPNGYSCPYYDALFLLAETLVCYLNQTTTTNHQPPNHHHYHQQ